MGGPTTKINDTVLEFITACCRNLESLNISQCIWISNNGWRSLFSKLGNSLKYLIMDHCLIDTDVLLKIPAECKTLKYLQINGIINLSSESRNHSESSISILRSTIESVEYTRKFM